VKQVKAFLADPSAFASAAPEASADAPKEESKKEAAKEESEEEEDEVGTPPPRVGNSCSSSVQCSLRLPHLLIGRGGGQDVDPSPPSAALSFA